MPELKVECDCGQKYKFDVEPVNGRMPFTVSCPTCGVDGTPKANDLLQQTAGVTPAANPIHLIELPPIGAASTASAPPPVASAPAPVASAPASPAISSPTTPPAGAPKLRINIAAHAPAPVENAPPPVAPAGPPGAITPPLGRGPGRIGSLAAAVDPDKPVKKPNFWMGIVGSFLGSLIGGTVYYLLLTLFGLKSLFSMGLGSLGLLVLIWIGSLVLTIGVGYLSGAGAAFLGKGDGSKELGGIAAIFALAAIIGAQYFIALTWWHQARQIGTDAVYSMAVETAKDAVAAVPTGSDSEIRSYLAKQASDEGDDVNSNSITADQIKEFRDEQLPQDQGLASGQITKKQFFAHNFEQKGKHRLNTTQDDGSADENADEGTVKVIFLALLLRKSNIFMLIAAAGLAYRITANA